ncbi:MAG: chromate reductase [Cellvibrionaceae bacterium]|jgi:chromate reductase
MSEKSEKIKVLALVGSLRKASINKALVEAAAEVAPDGMEITIFPLNGLPVYDNDVELQGFPDSVLALHQAIEASDAMILATPEYNGSYSGVIKNGIDWASRGGSRLATKPVVTMGGSPGALGGTKAQEHLRAVCLHLGMYLMPKPTVAVPQLMKKIEDGKLTDEGTREFVAGQMSAFKTWILRF